MITENIPLELIRGPAHPHRLDYDSEEMAELEASIKANGLINAILVKPIGNLFEVIAGERRWRAHINLKQTTIRCTISDDRPTENSELSQIAENFDRSNLSPMEEALAIARIADRFNQDFQSVARAIHRTTNFVQSRLALLNMQPELKEHVHTRTIAITTALHLAKVDNDEHRAHLLRWTINGGASEPVVREWVNQYELNKTSDPNAPPLLPPAYTEGATPVVLLPCKLCGEHHPYQQLRIARLCSTCDDKIERAHLAQ